MSSRTTSRTGLFLMELILAILLFSLSGAVCIQLFVQAHLISSKSVILNHSILWAQNTAETFYGCNGDAEEMLSFLNSDDSNFGTLSEKAEGTTLSFYYHKDFTPIPPWQSFFPPSGYVLTATVSPGNDLTTCHILVQEFSFHRKNNRKSNETLYELNLSLFPKQEVSDNGK